MDRWSASDVASWASQNGFPQHARDFLKHEITGELLVRADHAMLKALGITAVGDRIVLLNKIYNEKINSGIPIDEDDYIPQHARHMKPLPERMYAELSFTEFSEKLAFDVQRLERIIEEKAPFSQSMDSGASRIVVHLSGLSFFGSGQMSYHAIQSLSDSVGKLSFQLMTLQEDLQPVWTLVKGYKKFQKKSTATPIPHVDTALLNQPHESSLLATSVRHGSPNVMVTPSLQSSVPSVISPGQQKQEDLNVIRIYIDRLLGLTTSTYKVCRVRPTHTCASIIAHVLRDCKINDHWRDFALCMESSDSATQCLSFNATPLQIHLDFLNQGKDAPKFTLRHIKQNKTQLQRAPSTLQNSQMRRTPEPLSSTELECIAIGIYEYSATREDETDIAIGDRLKIVATEGGWSQVERSNGLFWAPSGCLWLPKNEEAVPTTGWVLYDYFRVSKNELTVSKGTKLLIHRKAEHWLLVSVGEQSGWVPSSYISTTPPEERERNDEVSPRKLASALATTPLSAMVRSRNMEFRSDSASSGPRSDGSPALSLPADFRDDSSAPNRVATDSAKSRYAPSAYSTAVDDSRSHIGLDAPLVISSTVDDMTAILNRLKERHAFLTEHRLWGSAESSRASSLHNLGYCFDFCNILLQSVGSNRGKGLVLSIQSSIAQRLQTLVDDSTAKLESLHAPNISPDLITTLLPGLISDIFKALESILAMLTSNAAEIFATPTAYDGFSYSPSSGLNGDMAQSAAAYFAAKTGQAHSSGPSPTSLGYMGYSESQLPQANKPLGAGGAPAPKLSHQHSFGRLDEGRSYSASSRGTVPVPADASNGDHSIGLQVDGVPMSKGNSGDPALRGIWSSKTNDIHKELQSKIGRRNQAEEDRAGNLSGPNSPNTVPSPRLKKIGSDGGESSAARLAGTGVGAPAAIAKTYVYDIRPYEDLVSRRDPDLDMANLERYLSNEDCQRHFGMSREELQRQPPWKIRDLKK
ncbi:uncharacterized protein BJ171DRAFT_474520 [Polychytrium aggregatum]|uniref:uncharacterized protein n=1 Tax=Polychytrium aggregatum TaxID=110093 RepID=UPI0022FF25D1|nr:uncharacterized protein BJ171DRAFT_474520 [Polychytrium aggregatum]KAI9205107.1 hypothetical protein BJ171DRAFT_474520 [Polychytrium aggregatum]